MQDWSGLHAHVVQSWASPMQGNPQMWLQNPIATTRSYLVESSTKKEKKKEGDDSWFLHCLRYCQSRPTIVSA